MKKEKFENKNFKHMRKKRILKQAIVAMGYRKGNDTTFLKPFGLSLLEGQFITEKDKDIFRITLLIQGRLNVFCWNYKDVDYIHPEEQWTNVDESIDGEELFELYCKMIASVEDSIGMENCVNLYREDKPMAFTTPHDVYHWME